MYVQHTSIFWFYSTFLLHFKLIFSWIVYLESSIEVIKELAWNQTLVTRTCVDGGGMSRALCHPPAGEITSGLIGRLANRVQVKSVIEVLSALISAELHEQVWPAAWVSPPPPLPRRCACNPAVLRGKNEEPGAEIRLSALPHSH